MKILSQIAKFMGPTWGPWTLLSGNLLIASPMTSATNDLIIWDNLVLAFHKKIFQLHTTSRCLEMMENIDKVVDKCTTIKFDKVFLKSLIY